MFDVNPLASNLSNFSSAVIDQDARQAEALEQFEKVFLAQMLREMRKTVPESSLFGRSSQTEHFVDMLDDVYAGKLAESGQFGVAQAIKTQLEAREAFTLDKGTITEQARKLNGDGLSLFQKLTPLALPDKDSGMTVQKKEDAGIKLFQEQGLALHPKNINFEG